MVGAAVVRHVRPGVGDCRRQHVRQRTGRHDHLGRVVRADAPVHDRDRVRHRDGRLPRHGGNPVRRVADDLGKTGGAGYTDPVPNHPEERPVPKEDIKWTCGFATIDHAAPPHPETIRNQFTIQSLLTHPLVEEVIVVDNAPENKTPLEEFCRRCGPRVRYVPMSEPKGTSPPRNRVFAESKSEFTACMDGHVILGQNFFPALSRFYDRHGRKCQDLLHGTMVNERWETHAHHMNDQWRGEMWGTWGTAWVAPNGRNFSCVHPGDDRIVFVTLDDNAQRPLTEAEIDSYGLHPAKKYPGLYQIWRWSGHESILKDIGCKHPREPFMIPGHGMGFFACRTDSWLPFHPDARGFGGEEMTTAVRYRQAFRRCWTVPDALWWHDFGRWYATQAGQAAVPYRLTLWDKVRNYVLEFKRLGLPLDPVREHFPAPQFPEHEWQQLLAGAWWPDGVADPGPPEAARAVSAPATAAIRSVDQTFLDACAAETDAAQDLPFLRKLAAECGPDDRPGRVLSVVVGDDNLSDLAFLAAAVPQLILVARIGHSDPPMAWIKSATIVRSVPMSDSVRAEVADRCDLLYLDIHPYLAQAVWNAILKYGPLADRYIVIRGSTKYPEVRLVPGEESVPLVLPAVRTFLMQNLEWTSVAQYQTPYGLIVLSKSDADKAKPPSLLRKAVNFGIALATHVAGGLPVATPQLRNERLEACIVCPQRFHDYCARCGCNVVQKAGWAAETCPDNLWPKEA